VTAAERGVAVVTGATGGMGRVLALALARRGLHVVAIARDPRRAADLRAAVAAGGGSLDVVAGDLSHRDGIVAATSAIRERYDTVRILINNAGAHYAERRLSVDGIEMHIAVDFVAAYGMTALLAPELRRGDARVVNVASDTLRDTRQVKLFGAPRPATIDVDQLDDLASLNPARGFVPFEAYARAKLLTVTAGYALAHTLGGDVTVNAVHPGIVATDIIDDLVPKVLRPFGGLIRRTMLTPEQGAAAAIRLATDPALHGVTGRYFVRETDTVTPPVSYDTDVQNRLRATTDRFLGHVDAT
jgi:NAD(P)-dependent dehydrogenase (short-subunit alcohol dehydrogenase family)